MLLKTSFPYTGGFFCCPNKMVRFTICRRAVQTVKEASQSLRPQAQTKFKAFLPAACTSAKILLGSQTCERKRVRCSEPQPFQTRAQRSGSRLRACQKSFFDTLRNPPAGVLFLSERLFAFRDFSTEKNCGILFLYFPEQGAMPL